MISFEQFLSEKHCSQNPQLLDDMLPDDFDDWLLERVDIEDIIKWAEEWHLEEIKKLNIK